MLFTAASSEPPSVEITLSDVMLSTARHVRKAATPIASFFPMVIWDLMKFSLHAVLMG